MKNYFHYSKVATMSDLRDDKWKACYSFLEKEQRDFSVITGSVNLDDYGKKWPKEALYWWSRIWEYPYVYSQLESYILNFTKKERLNVVDFGSGVTFFPFCVSKLGVDLFCIDNDKLVIDNLNSINSVLDSGQKDRINPVLSTNEELPFEDNSIDIIYSISVIEHLKNWHQIIPEFFRVLKKEGICILTFDICLSEGYQLDVNNFLQLNQCIKEKFSFFLPETSVHPLDILTSRNSPYPIKELPALNKLKYTVRHQLFPLLRGKKPFPGIQPLYLGVQGLTLKPKLQ